MACLATVPLCRSPGGPAACGLVQTAWEGIVVLDAQRRILSINAAAESLFGCSAEQLVGEAFESLLAGDAQTTTQCGKTPRTAGGDPLVLAGGRLGRRRDGSTFPMDLSLVRLCPEGSPDAGGCYAAFVHDLSTASALEREVRMLQQRLRTMVELAPIGIWVVADHRVLLANRAAGRLCGVESGEALVGQSIYTLLRVESHAEMRRQIQHALSYPEEHARLPARVARRDGDVCDVEIALASLPDHGSTTVQMVVSDVSQRNREAQELERSRRVLQRMSANAVEAREEERRRIARELHDELGQSLSALKMEIAECAHANGPGSAPAPVQSILQHVDAIMASVRRIAADLRPLMLDDLGLADAIESLVGEFSRRHGVRVHLHLEAIEPPVDQKVAIALYRVVQEALNNVVRHAHASEVHIDLGRHGDELVLSIDDDGIGLPEQAALRDSQFGLLGMEERAGMLGGRLELDNAADGGARVSVRVPLHRAPAVTSSPRQTPRPC